MAGKTLLGIGNGSRDGGRSSGDAPAGRGDSNPAAPTSLATVTSGPTLVDDEKVKEGLRRLRSLDSSSHNRSQIDPLAATVARSLEPLPREPRAESLAHGQVPALPPLPSAAAARSLDNLVPLSEGGSGPNASATALVRRQDIVSERGTLVGRDLHLPPEFGGKGRGEREHTPGPERERERALAPSPRPKVPPRLPAGVKPPVPRSTKPSARRRIDDTVQVRSRPNLAARIVIVLTTAAAVALLGVAAIRWHRDDEMNNQPPPRPANREWPSSETMPTTPSRTAPEPTRREAPARATVPVAAPSRGVSSDAVTPSPRGVENVRPEPQLPSGIDREGAGMDQPLLVDPKGDSARHRRRREKADAPQAVGTAPAAQSSSGSAGTSPPPVGTTPAPLGRENRPTKQKGNKDDPDSTLPLDLE